MIAVRLMGGLGNQMFQYAAGRALAARTGGELVFDLSALRADPRRGYALGPYPVRGREAAPGELERFPPRPPARGRAWALAARLRAALAPRGAGPVRFDEPHFHYAPAFAALAGDVYLDGYWQSARYFAPVAEAVRAELTLPALSPAAAELAARIAAGPSVGLHVRRGDYVSDPRIARTHGALPPDYHRRALALAAEGLGRPEVFVFTDDPGWVATGLDLGAPFTLVRGLSAHEDLHLLSLCRGRAIANSSFSWWAAWLGGPGRVVAPARWFGPERMRTRRLDDLCPPGWVRT
ncbi:alpha-1,2-fucosyltransferase [Desulfocurvus vexinensis]|uniref:alpha-1,2-fucosyltransferase n=1 Tax=Desulfocurvus vexinensis TaxID=399548 RepID=UPI00048F724C|nr:alpha-1,2-fucosyltransferase [Desulfocurvus vexinensis]